MKGGLTMKGTMTLKIVAAPNTKAQVLIEKTDAEMPIREMRTFQEMVVSMEDTINKLNGYKEG